MKNINHDENNEGVYKKSFRAGLTNFLVLVAAIIFYFAILRLPQIANAIGKFFYAAKPVTYGLFIAYLLNPIVKFIDSKLNPSLSKKINKDTAKKISRSIAILVAIAVMLAIIITLINLVVPNIYNSIKTLLATLPGEMENLEIKFNDLRGDNQGKSAVLSAIIVEIMEKANDYLNNNIAGKIDVIVEVLTKGVVNFVSEIVKVIVGIIVSIYVLYGKEKMIENGKRFIFAHFKAKKANDILKVLKTTDSIFGGFIVGKILDSMIIGVLCYIGNIILKMPYPILVAALVGVTNIIPFFGPYLGAVPSFLLIAIEDPIKGLYFLLFILALQQLDGNVIGPKILGDSTGLDAFWVIFAILIGGGLFGIPGMILGVPSFALICYLIDERIKEKLKRKSLPVNREYYKSGVNITDEGVYVSLNGEAKEKENMIYKNEKTEKIKK